MDGEGAFLSRKSLAPYQNGAFLFVAVITAERADYYH
jgi:hypothetical protein